MARSGFSHRFKLPSFLREFDFLVSTAAASALAKETLFDAEASVLSELEASSFLSETSVASSILPESQPLFAGPCSFEAAETAVRAVEDEERALDFQVPALFGVVL